MDITDLPNELLQTIFDFINYSDKLNWIYVNKQLNKMKLEKPYVLLGAPIYSCCATLPEYFISLNRLPDLINQTQVNHEYKNTPDKEFYYEYYVYIVIPNKFTRWSPNSHFDFSFLIHQDKIEWHKSWLEYWPNEVTNIDTIVNKCYDIYLDKLKMKPKLTFNNHKIKIQ